MNAIKDKLTFDPYEVLGISKDSTDAQIVKAFRKNALKWHPDKNLDRKKLSEEMFLKISQAFELLSDSAARAAYDQLRAAETAKTIYIQRRKQTDSAQRARFREELERREANVISSQEEAKLAQRKFDKEIERLRKEGSRLLQQERENIEKEVHKNFRNCSDKPTSSAVEVSPARLKVKWKTTNSERKLLEEDLLRLFETYGKVTAVVMSSSGKGSAIIEFEDPNDALKAESEKGTSEIPFKVSWISDRPNDRTSYQSDERFPSYTPRTDNIAQRLTTTAAEFADFEAEILAKMMATGQKKPGDGSRFDDY